MKPYTEIKSIAKGLVSGTNYWKSVLVLLLANLITGVASSALAFTAIGTFAATVFLGTLFLGTLSYFLRIYSGETPDISDSVSGMFKEAFPNDYIKKVGGIAWMYLWVVLWTLLFIIPGAVKSYSYAMTNYILLKRPDIPAKEALKVSMKIMEGHKMELFMLHLSFIGWLILSSLTCGLLYVLYVGPYIHSANAIFYDDLYNQAAKDSLI